MIISLIILGQPANGADGTPTQLWPLGGCAGRKLTSSARTSASLADYKREDKYVRKIPFYYPSFHINESFWI